MEHHHAGPPPPASTNKQDFTVAKAKDKAKLALAAVKSEDTQV